MMVVPGSQEPLVPPPGALHVLVIEDNAADAMIAGAAVSRAATGPYVLLRAESLAQALELVATREVDLALMDLNLPDSRGVASLRRLRAATSAPVIVITTDDTAGLDESALAAGAFDILHKGRIDVEAIAALLRAAEKHRHGRRAP